MFTKSENLIEEYTKLMHKIRSARETISNHQAKTVDEMRQISYDSVNDMHAEMCWFLSKMLSAPCTGRVFITPPSSYLELDTKQKSIDSHMNI